MDSQGSSSIKDSADPPHHYQDCIPSQPCLVRINQIVSNPRFLFRSILPNNWQVPRQILFLSGCWTLSHFKSCKFLCFEQNPQQTDPFLESKTVPSSPVWSFSFLAQNRNLSLIKSQHLLRLSIIYHTSEKNAWRTSSHHYQATLARMLRHDILQTQISNAVSSLLQLLARYQFKSQQQLPKRDSQKEDSVQRKIVSYCSD